MKAITNTKLVMEDGIIWDGILTYENGIILEVGHAKDIVIPKDAEIIDAGGLYTAPGLIDIHNHGFGGHLFWEKPLECCKYFLAHGETTVLPTFYSDMTLEQYKESADLIRKQSKFGAGKIMEGIYMEGPYMRPEGGNEKYIKWRGKITQEEFQPLVDSLSDIVRIWAVDPERNVDDFMAYAKKETQKSSLHWDILTPPPSSVGEFAIMACKFRLIMAILARLQAVRRVHQELAATNIRFMIPIYTLNSSAIIVVFMWFPIF